MMKGLRTSALIFLFSMLSISAEAERLYDDANEPAPAPLCRLLPPKPLIKSSGYDYAKWLAARKPKNATPISGQPKPKIPDFMSRIFDSDHTDKVLNPDFGTATGVRSSGLTNENLGDGSHSTTPKPNLLLDDHSVPLMQHSASDANAFSHTNSDDVIDSRVSPANTGVSVHVFCHMTKHPH